MSDDEKYQNEIMLPIHLPKPIPSTKPAATATMFLRAPHSSTVPESATFHQVSAFLKYWRFNFLKKNARF